MKTIELVGLFNRRIYWPVRELPYGEPSRPTKEEAHKLFVASYPGLPYHHQDLPVGGFFANNAPSSVRGNTVIWEIPE